MKLIRNLDNLPDSIRSGALSIGNFDGVHRGHIEIVRRLIAAARRVQGPAVVFTFDPHPATILRPNKQITAPLTWIDRKAQLLDELGVDATIAYPTDTALLGLEARQFFQQVVCRWFDAKAMVEGRDFVFGRDRQGDIDELGEFCREKGMLFDPVDPIQVNGRPISSSWTRVMVLEGRLEEANRLLSRPYRIRGRVVQGARRGSELGYPTANLDQIETLLPSEGIYAGRCNVDGRSWPAAISLGPNPTFQEDRLKVEVHLIGYDGSLYDRRIEVDFFARLRDIERFDSVDRLLTEMARDIQTAKRIAESHAE